MRSLPKPKKSWPMSCSRRRELQTKFEKADRGLRVFVERLKALAPHSGEIRHYEPLAAGEASTGPTIWGWHIKHFHEHLRQHHDQPQQPFRMRLQWRLAPAARLRFGASSIVPAATGSLAKIASRTACSGSGGEQREQVAIGGACESS
jgi:hypothetical protein